MNTNGTHDTSSPHTTGLNWSTTCSSSHFMSFLYIIFITLHLQASDLLTDNPLDSYKLCIISGPLPSPALVMKFSHAHKLHTWLKGHRCALGVQYVDDLLEQIHSSQTRWISFKGIRVSSNGSVYRTCAEVLPVTHTG